MHDRARHRRFALLLALLTLAVFSPAVENGFLLFDDTHLITANPVVRGGLSPAGVRWALTSVDNANWFPVTRLGQLVNVELFGLWAGGHHLAALLVHAASACLLFLALARATGAAGPALAAAAVFAIHPLRVESVAWAAELSDVLATFFFLLALHGHLRRAARPGAGGGLPTAAVFALALASKPTAVMLPVLLLVLDFWPLGRMRRPPSPFDKGGARGIFPLVREKLPLLALSLAAGLATIATQHRAGAVGSIAAYPPDVRILNTARSAAAYLGKLLVPAGLSPFYPHPGDGIDRPAALAAAALLLLLTVVAFRAARTRPWLAAGWTWYLAALLPLSGLLQVGFHAMADRFTYLPLVGVTVAAAWELDRRAACRPRGRALLAGAAAAFLAALALLTPLQVRRWRDTGTLFAHALALDPGNWLAHLKLAEVARGRGAPAEALPHLETVVALEPGNFYARTLLGVTLGELGRGEEALAALAAAVRTAPGWADARHNYAVALANAGRPGEAAEQLRAELRIEPGSGRARKRLAVLEAALASRGGR